MENASKALLMAGGVLLTMLIVMLLIFFKGKIVEFYDEQDKIDDIANISEFNKQFTNYERDKVYGYEIISLSNMTEDYNIRHSNEGSNDENYKPITLNVVFPNGTNVADKIWYDISYSNHLFYDNKTYSQSSTKNEIVKIITDAINYERLYGNTDITTKLAKSIKSLIVDEKDDEGQINNLMNTLNIDKNEAIKRLQIQAVNDYKAITKSNNDITYPQMEGLLLNNTTNIMQYYEYYQFKKAIFKCTNVEYYNDYGETGRIKSMTFTFTGKVE